LVHIRAIATSNRCFVPRQQIPKNRAMMDMLWQYREAEFRQETRMTRISFGTLVRFIEQHPIFHNSSRNQQGPV
jgi:hypothetical protein